MDASVFKWQSPHILGILLLCQGILAGCQPQNSRHFAGESLRTLDIVFSDKDMGRAKTDFDDNDRDIYLTVTGASPDLQFKVENSLFKILNLNEPLDVQEPKAISEEFTDQVEDNDDFSEEQKSGLSSAKKIWKVVKSKEKSVVPTGGSGEPTSAKTEGKSPAYYWYFDSATATWYGRFPLPVGFDFDTTVAEARFDDPFVGQVDQTLIFRPIPKLNYRTCKIKKTKDGVKTKCRSKWVESGKNPKNQLLLNEDWDILQVRFRNLDKKTQFCNPQLQSTSSIDIQCDNAGDFSGRKDFQEHLDHDYSDKYLVGAKVFIFQMSRERISTEWDHLAFFFKESGREGKRIIWFKGSAPPPEAPENESDNDRPSSP